MVLREIDQKELMNELNITVMKDDGELRSIVQNVLGKHASVVEQYKGGKETSIQFLIGMVMRESKGTADPEKVKELAALWEARYGWDN